VPAATEEIAEFLRAVDGLVADAQLPAAVGSAVVAEELPLVWRRLNVLRVDAPVAEARLVVEEAERVLGGAGFGHRGVVLRSPAFERTAIEIECAGWVLDHELVLVHHHTAMPPAAGAEEVGLDDLEGMFEEFRRARPYGSDEGLVAQLAALDRRYAERAGARFFAARADGGWASSCQLFSRGGIAEVHAVGTRAPYRGQGLAGAVIAAALEASAASGNRFTFLQTMKSDWPQHLYRSLGFEDVGLFYELYRFEPGHPAAPLYEQG
jgi:ribosomal protein S18 acetylase RimI-like enzyme